MDRRREWLCIWIGCSCHGSSIDTSLSAPFSQVAELLKDSPRVALLDAIISGPLGESGPEATAVEDVLKTMAGKRCFLPDG